MGDYIKTFMLLGFLGVLIVLIGGWIGGEQGLWLAFIFSLLMNGVAYFFSDKIALKSSGAKPLDRAHHPQLYSMVQDLTNRMKMPMPKLYIIPSPQANAFATGRNPNHAAVAVTEGIMKQLDFEELRGVVAHELAHIKNRDILISTIAAVLASSLAFVSRMGMYGGMGSNEDNRGAGAFGLLLAILAPIGGMLVQMAISREREYEADETGAEVLGNGEPLAQALIKIHQSTQRAPMDVNPAFSSLYIANPFGGLNNLSKLFSTHPPMEERVKRLRTMR